MTTVTNGQKTNQTPEELRAELKDLQELAQALVKGAEQGKYTIPPRIREIAEYDDKVS